MHQSHGLAGLSIPLDFQFDNDDDDELGRAVCVKTNLLPVAD